MAKQTVRLGDADVTLKTYKTNLFVLKEIGAEVRIVPRKKKHLMFWQIAAGFSPMSMGISSKRATEILSRTLGEPKIELTARFFGQPDDLRGRVEFEAAPLHINQTRFLCRARHQAIGLMVKIKEGGGFSGSPNALLELRRVTATATVRLGDQVAHLSVGTP